MKYKEGNVVIVAGYPGLSMIIGTKITTPEHPRLQHYGFEYVIQRLDKNEAEIDGQIHGIFEKEIEKLIR